MRNRLLRTFFISLLTAVLIAAGLYSYCYYVEGTSIMAFLSSVYLEATDFNGIYEDEEKCNQALKDMKLTNLKDLETPSMTNEVTSRHVGRMQYFSVGLESKNDTVIFYFPGGAFIDQPKFQHWSFINKLNTETGIPVIVPVYPKVTSYNASKAYEEIISLYRQITADSSIKHVILMGDSSGGNIALSLAMQIREMELTEPEKLILISPWLDLSMDNEIMKDYEEDEFMVGIDGLKILGRKWAGDSSIYDPVISPLYGNFVGLGKIIIFSGEKDMLHPDILRLNSRLEKDKVDFTLYIAENMPHVYPLFPTPEAKEAFEIIKASLTD